MTLGELNQSSEAEFVRVLGAIYEHSAWVAARVAWCRPFTDVAALQSAMAKVVKDASAEEQAGLIAAHPDLGGRLARAGALAPSSADEQASLGLDRLTDEEFLAFEALNTSYTQRFGFPFIIAVKQHTRKSVLAAFEERLGNDATTERAAALHQIDIIAAIRLHALLGGADPGHAAGDKRS